MSSFPGGPPGTAGGPAPPWRPIDGFNKNVIASVMRELTRESEQGQGMGSGMNDFGGFGNFTGMNEDQPNGQGVGGLMNEDETSMAKTLEQLQFHWEDNFQKQ